MGLFCCIASLASHKIYTRMTGGFTYSYINIILCALLYIIVINQRKTEWSLLIHTCTSLLNYRIE